MTTSRRSGTELKRVDLFSSENPDGPDLSEVASYLESILPTLQIAIRKPLLSRISVDDAESLAERLARARIKDVGSATQSSEPMLGEIEYELRALRNKVRLGGIVYDARMLEDLLMQFIRPRPSPDRAAVVFTDRLVSTYSHDDLRHHLRTVICGFPSIVSVPGVVEAPAKPREYYILKQRMESEGLGDLQLAKLKAMFRGRFIDYGDKEMAHVLRGLALQALLFHLTLEPFCLHRHCRLFNAHWQEDLIASQVASERLCKKHASELKRLAKSPIVRWA